MKDYLLQQLAETVKAAPLETQLFYKRMTEEGLKQSAVSERFRVAKRKGNLQRAYEIKLAIDLMKTHKFVSELEQ